MERAAALARAVLDGALARCVAGVTPRQVERFIASEIAKVGAAPVDPSVFAAVASIAVNDAAAHALPSDEPLRDGDLVTVDLPLRCAGWWADLADTVAVGRPGGDRLVDSARSVLEAMAGAIRPGQLWSQVARAGREQAEMCGVGLVSSLAGHGIGRALHEPPMAWLGAGPDFTLRPGLCLTLEPVVTGGCGDLVEACDGVTLRTVDGSWAAGLERVAVVTRSGCRLLGDGEMLGRSGGIPAGLVDDSE